MSTQTFQPQTNLLDAEQVRYDFEGSNILGASLVKHYIYAATTDHAEAILTRAKIEVDAITPHREGLRRRKRALSREELGTFAIQLAERTKASDPIPKAILDIARSTTNRLLREALLDVYAEIKKESVNLDQAFNIRADVFPDAFRHIIRVGTTKGDPSDLLSKYGERQLLTAENMAKVKGALIYPSVVLSLATAIVIVLSFWVIPQMERMYEALIDPRSGASLPWLTKALLTFSNFLVSFYGLITMGLVVLAIVMLIRWLRTDNGKDWFQRKSLNWPLIGKLIREFNAAHVIDLMAILAPVLTPTEFLREASAAALNVVYRESLDAIRESFRSGALDLTTAMTPYARLFGDEFAAAVATGEQTGRLAAQLGNYARLVDRRVQESTARLSKTVEPMTLIIAGIVIGLIVVAAYWPLFSLVGDLANNK
jgi:type II secretory pathway component PulF